MLASVVMNYPHKLTLLTDVWLVCPVVRRLTHRLQSNLGEVETGQRYRRPYDGHEQVVVELLPERSSIEVLGPVDERNRAVPGEVIHIQGDT